MQDFFHVDIDIPWPKARIYILMHYYASFKQNWTIILGSIKTKPSSINIRSRWLLILILKSACIAPVQHTFK